MIGEQGKVIDIFSGQELTADSNRARYSEAMAEVVVPELGEMGLEPAFMAMLSRHVGDMRLAFYPKGVDKASGLHVLKDEDTDKFVRVAALNEAEVINYKTTLFLSGVEYDSPIDEQTAKRIAVEWIFCELIADALANVYDIEEKVGKYVKDFNGQSPHYVSHLSISRHFYNEYTDGQYFESDLEKDHLAFRRGMALHFLPTFILSYSNVESYEVAKRISQKFANQYPCPEFAQTSTAPMNEESVKERLRFMKPRFSRAKFLEFILAEHNPDENVTP
ncbi:MAG: hypothetical protein M3Q36_01670 [bacterium]|nr:hypothetical protein [bacterium]